MQGAKSIPWAIAVAIVLALPAVKGAAQPAPGQIIVDPAHPQWLIRAGGGPVHLCGPGDPEDFLYRGERMPDGTRRGDQMDLIRKLQDHGGNCIYVMADASGDNGADAHPFLDPTNPAKGLNEAMLDQWEQWFSAMDESGIAVFFLLYDDGVKRFESGDVPPPEEELFVRALVERFKHHRNWIWCVAEESEEAFSMPRARAIAALIAKYDDRGHVIANHHHNGVVFKSYEDGCALTQFAIQFTGTVEEMHAGVLEAWRGAAGRYNLNMAEPHTPGRLAAWASAMAGAHFMELDMDIASTPPQRLDECRTQQRFFESTDFNTMAPRDELARGGTKWVLADPGRSYIAYAERLEGAMGLAGMAAGEYDLRWVDCVSGAIAEQTANVEQAGEGSFPRPESIGPECAVWVRLKGASAGATAAGDILEAKDGDAPLRALDRRIAVRAGRESPIQLDYRGGSGPGPYVYTVTRPPAHGTLAGRNNDLIYRADPDYEGTDSFQWIVNDGQADSNAATVSIEVRK